jgi:hypothetical protein
VSLQSDVTARLAPWLNLLVSVVRNNPSGDIYDMLARPDISDLLERGLINAQVLVENALDEAWPPGSSPYRASLVADIARIYSTAESDLRQAAADGFRLVPQQVFVPGVSEPGSNPSMEAAQHRAQEVQRQVAVVITRLGFRNQMTADVAPVRRRGEEVLSEAASGLWMVKWVCRKGPDGRPDKRVCRWCRELDAMGPIPLGSEFPAGRPVRGMRPPRVYFNLRCPPRHPRCRCYIILIRAGGGRDAEEGADQATAPLALFISSDDIRDIPEDRYHALTDFHRAALHELGQVIRQHRQGRL